MFFSLECSVTSRQLPLNKRVLSECFEIVVLIGSHTSRCSSQQAANERGAVAVMLQSHHVIISSRGCYACMEEFWGPQCLFKFFWILYCFHLLVQCIEFFSFSQTIFEEGFSGHLISGRARSPLNQCRGIDFQGYRLRRVPFLKYLHALLNFSSVFSNA